MHVPWGEPVFERAVPGGHLPRFLEQDDAFASAARQASELDLLRLARLPAGGKDVQIAAHLAGAQFDYPEILRQVPGALQKQNEENWNGVREELVAVLREEV